MKKIGKSLKPIANVMVIRHFGRIAKMIAIVLLCAQSLALRAAEPLIFVDRIVPIGQSGNAVGRIVWDGLNYGNAGQYAVIAMLHALWEGGGGYYVKPFDNNYLNSVDAFGNFSILITTGGIDTEVDEVIFYLVERTRITNADIANPSAMNGKYLATKTIYRSQFVQTPDPPVSNHQPGFITAGTRITLSRSGGGGAIRFTTDGSNPVTSSTAQTYNNQTLTVPSNGSLLVKAVVGVEDKYSRVASFLWLPAEPLITKFWGLNVSLALNGEAFGYPLSEAVTRERIEPLVPLTKWVRTFGTLNNGLEYINKIAKEFGMRTLIGVYITDNAANNTAQIEGLRRILQQGPNPDLIAVGNETSLASLGPEMLAASIDAVRDMLLQMRLNIPVGSVDIAGASWNTSLLEKLDFTGVNMYHGVWDNVSESQMLSTSKQTYRNTVSANPYKLVLLTEIGVPYCCGTYAYLPGRNQTASEAKAAAFLCGFLDWIAQENIPSFYFEAYNEPTKSQNGGHSIEQYFGIMDGNLKQHAFHPCLPNSNEMIASSLKISPNPFTDDVIVQGAEGCTLTVYTESGVSVYTQKIAGSNETIRIESLAEGVYFFYFEKEGKSQTLKSLKTSR